MSHVGYYQGGSIADHEIMFPAFHNHTMHTVFLGILCLCLPSIVYVPVDNVWVVLKIYPKRFTPIYTKSSHLSFVSATFGNFGSFNLPKLPVGVFVCGITWERIAYSSLFLLGVSAYIRCTTRIYEELTHRDSQIFQSIPVVITNGLDLIELCQNFNKENGNKKKKKHHQTKVSFFENTKHTC